MQPNWLFKVFIGSHRIKTIHVVNRKKNHEHFESDDSFNISTYFADLNDSL